jgi:para-aminobenzoate synthetase component 1
MVAARPFLTVQSIGARSELAWKSGRRTQYGNSWHILNDLMARYELPAEMDLPFPSGGCFGWWGYDLKSFVEQRLRRHATNDLEMDDVQVGFYGSLVVFDHRLGKTWVVATGLDVEGARTTRLENEQFRFWQKHLALAADEPFPELPAQAALGPARSNLSKQQFIEMVERARNYIHAGDIYQVNLSQRFSAPMRSSAWELFMALTSVSPAPYSAYFGGENTDIVSLSPELFLRMSGGQIQTRPIKGTRPRSCDPIRDAQLTYELQTSPKEMAELVMITDLLRNDFGRVCDYGSVQVPELVRLERFPHVQHLVSTVEGHLRSDVSHMDALAQCFPGGSITGAPKIRAMEIIDELEPVSRGPYTGCHGYLGFNRESQLSMTIRTASCLAGVAHFHAGAGIVADSIPEAEFEETLAKARAFLDATRAAQPAENIGTPR